MRAFRSLLFVPGHKPGWVNKAIAAGTDALVLDLEDSVPEVSKGEARRAVADSIARLNAAGPSRVGIIVRPNAFDTNWFGQDLAAAVHPGLEALLLPKVASAADLHRFDGLLSHLELAAGMDRGTVELIPSLETAASVAHVGELATGPRVATVQSATARDGDIARDVGFSWTAEGLETLYLRSRALLACRSNGLTHPLCGVWQDIGDLDGLERFASQNRALGFRGQLVLHPSHVPVVNDVYSVSPTEAERAQRLLDCYAAALREGSASVVFEGEHIDTAHVKTARALLELAARQKVTA